MMRKLRDFFKRITGISTPIGGISWAPLPHNKGMSPSESTDSVSEQLLRFKSRDAQVPVLAALYKRQLDPGSERDRKILQNLSMQVRTESNRYGTALDVDTLELVYGKAPLVCRDLHDLQVVLQNQLELYTNGRELILRLWGLDPDGNYESDPLLRQVVADYEGKIRTPFRTKGIRLNLKTNHHEWEPLRVSTMAQMLDIIGIQLETRIRMGVRPGPGAYDLGHIDPSFVPTAGYNIV